jgi:MFS family permease
MTPRPEPALRSGKASSGPGGTRRQNGPSCDGSTDDPPRTTTCCQDTNSDQRQSQEASAFAQQRHPLHIQHCHQQEQQQHDQHHQQTAPLLSKGAAPTPPIVSRSSSCASLPSITAAAILPRVPSLADLEMGTTKKKKKQQNDERNNSQYADAQAISTSAYRRRRRKLRSFASFAPSSSTRLRRRHSTGASDHPSFFVPPTISIPLLNGIDMFAVSLVVPLLFQYYKSAGVSSAAQRELLSSLFSASQIVGGLLMGILTDANLVERKTILLLSFGGSAVSYALIAFGGLHALLLSRVLVGLVKQTMTVCTTILTYHTTREDRARGLGRLTASSTVAWVVGPTVGALLYRYVDPRAPALLACLLFVMNFVLATILIDRDHGHPKGTGDDDDVDNDDESSSSATKERTNGGSTAAVAAPPTSKWRVIVNNLRCCFGSRALGSAVATKLLLTWITKATNYSQLGSFYEDMYNLQPHHRGYISSYQQLLQFVVNVRLISPVLEWAGGERMATLYCVGIMAGAVYLESLRSLSLFLVVLCPVIALSFSISDLSLQTLVTHVAPPAGMFSVLAALDVLQNAVSVSVPFYRTWLFSHLPADSSVGAMVGDPDPVAWVRASSLHWLLAAAILSVVLTREAWWKEDHPHHATKAPAKKGK